ncbi:hypothetical protein [Kocuria sp.]|uniref:hypothetical protein n=1 Tax=Kocuria sp. TaxID=1871328 RepID=UPI0026DA7D2B|nr:hypothetical protein [Kocuria sp.]MDO4919915.1 hypothetical protein [Kocuria sp.]
MKYEVKIRRDGLWAVIAPSGQVAGLCPTRMEAMTAARGLLAFKAFACREVAA